MAEIILPDGRHNRAAAAKALGVSESWLAHVDAAGHGPAKIRMGRRIWYKQDDLAKFVEANRVEGDQWACTNTRSRPSGGAASKSAASTTVVARAREIAAKRKQESANCAAKLKAKGRDRSGEPLQ